MFARAVIFTSFNGFEKVDQKQKRRLSSVLNKLSGAFSYLQYAKPNADSLDGVYRNVLLNTETARMYEILTLLKEVAGFGINVEVSIVPESDFINSENPFRATTKAVEQFFITNHKVELV